MPDGKLVRFPSDMSEDQIQAAIRGDKPPVNEQEEAWKKLVQEENEKIKVERTEAMERGELVPYTTTPGEAEARLLKRMPSKTEIELAEIMALPEGERKEWAKKRQARSTRMAEARMADPGVTEGQKYATVAYNSLVQGLNLVPRLAVAAGDLVGIDAATKAQQYYASQDKRFAEEIVENGADSLGLSIFGAGTRAAAELIVPIGLAKGVAQGVAKAVMARGATAAASAAATSAAAATAARVALAAEAALAAQKAAVITSSVASGIQSGGSVYSERRTDGTGRGRLESLGQGLTAGTITGLTTLAFGASGIESIFKAQGVKGVANRVAAVTKAAGMESIEEHIDETGQILREMMTDYPQMGIGEIGERLLTAFTVGGILGGSISSASHVKNSYDRGRRLSKLETYRANRAEIMESMRPKIRAEFDRKNEIFERRVNSGEYISGKFVEDFSSFLKESERGAVVHNLQVFGYELRGKNWVHTTSPTEKQNTELVGNQEQPADPYATSESSVRPSEQQFAVGDIVNYDGSRGGAPGPRAITLINKTQDGRTAIFFGDRDETGAQIGVSLHAISAVPDGAQTEEQFAVGDTVNYDGAGGGTPGSRTITEIGKFADGRMSVHFGDKDQNGQPIAVPLDSVSIIPEAETVTQPVPVNEVNPSQVAPRAMFAQPIPEPIVIGDVVYGKKTKIKASGDQILDAQYGWVPFSKIEASHKGVDFAKNKRFSPVKNSRDYEKRPEQVKVIHGQVNFFNEEYINYGVHASLGPMGVSLGTDEVWRALLGSGRHQMIAGLSPKQRASFNAAQDRDAHIFHLPARPTDDHVLVRILNAHSVSSPEGIAATNIMVDILNPSPGLNEDAIAMATNDSARIPAHHLLKVKVDGDSKSHRDWVTGLISIGVLDRNTRTPLLASDTTVSHYVRHLLVNAAYGSPSISHLHASHTTSATVKGTIESAVPMLIRMREKGGTEVAEGFTGLLQRVAEISNRDGKSKKLRSILSEIRMQDEVHPSEAHDLARRLAAVMEGQLVEIENKNGDKRLDSDSTLENFNNLFNDFEISLAHFDPTPDFFGQSRTIAQAASDFLDVRLGKNIALRESSAGLPPADPRVTRLRKLRSEQAKRTLTLNEVDELVSIESELGQGFMGFFNEVYDREEKAKVAAKSLTEAQAATKKQLGNLTLQGEIITPSQGLLFASKPDDKTDFFPGFGVELEQETPDERKPTTRVVGPAESAGSGAVQSDWIRGAGPDTRSRTVSRPAKAVIKARAAHAPTSKPEDLVEKLAPELKKILRSHQVDEVNLALAAFGNSKNFGLFSGTGAGKTVTELATASLMAKLTGKPVVIITERDGIIGDSFARDAEMLGIKLWRYKGDTVEAGQDVLIATYNDVSAKLITPGQFETVIFDESHNLRNQGRSVRPHDGNVLANSTKHVMFASATPLDRPEGLWYLHSLLEGTPQQALLKIGIDVRQRQVNGENVTYFTVIEGITQSQIEQGLEAVFDQVYQNGLGIKHEVPLDNLTVTLRRVNLTDEDIKSVKGIIDAAEFRYKDHPAYARNGLVMMAARMALESRKAVQAMAAADKALAEGKQVIIYANRVEGGQWGLPHGLASMEAMMKAKYGDAVGSIYGGASTTASAQKTQRTLASFQNGDIKVLFSTPQSGGAGISLDDIHGDAPRHLILLTAPFSALDFVQIAGRINRLNTASPATMDILVANHRIDNWGIGIAMAKLSNLQAAVKGDLGDMNIDSAPIDTTPSPMVLRSNAVNALANLGAVTVQNGLTSVRAGATPDASSVAAPTADTVGVATLVEKQITEEMLHNGLVSIVGKSAKSVRELGVLLNLWRSPQFEVSAVHAMKNGVVIGSRPITARMPNATTAFPVGENINHTIQWLNDLGADSCAFSHNHPSGKSNPSGADINATRDFAGSLDKYWNGAFLGHVVTDHGQFHVIDGFGNIAFHKTSVSLTPDPLIGSNTSILGASALAPGGWHLSPEVITGIGNQVASVQRGETVALIFLSSASTVRAVYEVPIHLFSQLTSQDLRTIALGQGAVNVIAVQTVATTNQATQTARHALNLMAEGSLYDVLANGFSLKSLQYSDLTTEFLQLPFDAGKDWMGKSVIGKGRLVLREGTKRAEPIIMFSVIEGRKAAMPYNLGGLDHVNVIDAPEFLKLAKEFLGHTPKIKRLRGSAGVFSHSSAGFTIKIDPRVFQNPMDAMKVLAHEFGHLNDYLPDETMARGNILGRLASLKDWLSTTMSVRNTGKLDSLTDIDRRELRKKAVASAGPRPEGGTGLVAWQFAVAKEYAALKRAEIKTRGLVERDEVAAELRNLTKLWHPYDETKVGEAYIKYRNSSKELYADFISALFNAPSFTAETAPIAYKMFWDYLEHKPAMKASVFALHEFLSNGRLPVLEQRSADIQDAFARGEDIMLRKAMEREARNNSTRGWFLNIKQHFFDAAAPVLAKINTQIKSGVPVDPLKDPRRFIEEQLLMDNVNSRMLDLLHRGVLKPLEEAGISTGLLGEYLLFRRILHGDRAGVANPGAHDTKSAREGLLRIRLELGPEKMNALDRAVEKFNDITWSVVEEAVRVGSYSTELYETVLKPNKGFYAAFGVLEYLQDYVPAGVKSQVGTLSEIANPFTQTVLKMIALNNLNSIQRTKNSFKEFMAAHFGSEIVEAPTWFNGTAHVPVKHPDFGLFERLENGKPKWYYVDPFIAKSFENDSPTHLDLKFRALTIGFRKVFYHLWITYNAAFQLANIKRDWSRTVRNTGLTRRELGKYYFKGIRAAIDRHMANGNPLVTEMMQNYAFGSADLSYTDIDSNGSFLGKKMQKLGLLPDPPAEGMTKVFVGLTEWVKFTGNVIESMPKVAAYAALRAKGGTPTEVAMTVRNFVGTPNIYRRGKKTYLVRPFIPFYNVFIQGFGSDLKLATETKTAAGWWWRYSSTDGLWAVMTALAAAGALGDELRKLFEAIPGRDKANHNIIPLGIEPGGDFNGQTLYIRVPRDETSRLLSALIYNTVLLAAGDKNASFSDVLAVGGGQLPTFNPVLEIAAIWPAYVMGHNVVDPSTGRPIMSRTEQSAGGLHGIGSMAAWTYNKTGLQDFARITDLEGKEGWHAAIQFVPGVHRFIKSSDAGSREKQWADEERETQDSARHRLSYPKEVQSLISEYSTLRRLGVPDRTPAQQSRYKMLSDWNSKVFKPYDDAVLENEKNGDKSSAEFLRKDLKSSSEFYKRK